MCHLRNAATLRSYTLALCMNHPVATEDPMPREHGRWPLLTPRHREVLVLIVRGLTSREIAVELGISRRTVEVHRTNIMRRLGARNVSDLFREALLQRLIPKRY